MVGIRVGRLGVGQRLLRMLWRCLCEIGRVKRVRRKRKMSRLLMGLRLRLRMGLARMRWRRGPGVGG
jgi:hypothetical protein